MAGWQKKGTTTAQLVAGTDHIFVPYEFVQEAVSYTHLTLPTIYPV